MFPTGTYTLLHCDGSVIWRNFVTHEIRLEWDHASHCEQQSGIVWNQTRRWDNSVPFVGKVTGKSSPKRISRARDTGVS